MEWNNFFNFELWGNDGKAYAIAIGIFFGLTLIFKMFQMIVLARLKKASKRTETDLDDFLIDMAGHVKPPFYFMVALYLAVQYLQTTEFLGKIIFGAFVIAFVIQAIVVAQKVIDYVIRKKILKGDEGDKDKEAMIKLAGQLSKVGLWVFGGLLILSNLGVNVASLIAGLGIGGIAVALAVKDILGDIFASFSIFVDKPFKVGDFIELNTKEKGTVEKIGIKTTRLRTRQGQELIVANKTLTESTLQNYRRMQERRVTFELGIVYETTLEKLKKIPIVLSEIIEKQDKTTFERAHFKAFADSSLLFEVVYVVNDSAYGEYMDIQQAINFGVFEKFAEMGIEFAYPTQTLHLAKSLDLNSK